ncbi:MAG TPA: MMPL family transporter [Steroidobacteraceae bacterium]|nr:MMPL family transporter [Steroidobacteraceae bacterium]
MPSAFLALGSLVGRYPRRVIAVWAVAIGLGAWGAVLFPHAALGGSVELSGSPSKAVDDALHTQFDDPFLDPLIVAVSSPRFSIDQAPFDRWDVETAQALSRLPEVSKVAAYATSRDPSLRSASGHETMLLVAIAARDTAGQQRAVARLRAALAPLRAKLQLRDPAARLAVTGGPAVDYDINTGSAEGGDRAEKRALPLTLVILALAFGTLVAAVLPFLMGLAATMVALGAAFLLAQVMPVSNLLGNVVTMIGLAVGIDYSLLMVKDFRERLPRAEIRAAVAETVAEAGSTICWSGCTVAIGLLGLLFSPLLETRSVGIGGALVVTVAVLAALTLLPACLALLGNKIERWPIGFAAFKRWDRATLWRRLAAATVQRPIVSLILSCGAVLILALPIAGARNGFSNEPWFLPKGMESRLGMEMLARMQNANAALDLRILLRTNDGKPVLAEAHIADLAAYSAKLMDDRRVASIASPLSIHDAGARAAYISLDGRAALFDVIPAARLSVPQIQALARDLGSVSPPGPFTATVGGAPVYYNDFSDTMWKSFPKVFGFVIVATLVLLFAAFRSFLLPIKAVAANFLAIGAGYGAVVAVFQFGWLGGLVGLERPFSSIALEVPLMIFCLSFGLSMDYEVFLLFRIQREYLAHGDNARATVDGLAAVAPVITGAALIMAVVFGAFAAAKLPALKMIGVGLCVAVLVDATLIRGVIVPAFMSVAGRWNWFPGRPAERPSPIKDSGTVTGGDDNG